MSSSTIDMYPEDFAKIFYELGKDAASEIDQARKSGEYTLLQKDKVITGLNDQIIVLKNSNSANLTEIDRLKALLAEYDSPVNAVSPAADPDIGF